jgi:hypothetical protein
MTNTPNGHTHTSRASQPKAASILSASTLAALPPGRLFLSPYAIYSEYKITICYSATTCADSRKSSCWHSASSTQ